jgi:lipopolysaccharide export system permease protein
MDGISRYIFRQLAVGMVLVTLALTCVIWLSQSLRFIELIVNRGLSAGSFLYLTMLLLPNFLSIILPIALFTIVTFTYNKLNSDRELMVMRSAGVSQLSLAQPALLLTGIVVIALYAINLYFLPVSYRMFRELQWEIRYNYSNVLIQEGAFTNIAPGVTVYVRERDSNGDLKSILVHDARDKEKPTTLMAARGTMFRAGDQARVVMFDGNRQQVDKTTNKLAILYFDRYTFDLDSTPPETLERFREPRERMLDELFDVGHDPYVAAKDYGKFIVEGHKRLISPLSACAFALIGLAALLAAGYERRGQIRPVLVSVGCVVFLIVAALGLENICARDTRLIPFMYLNAVMPIIGAFYYLLRPPPRQGARPRAPAGSPT